MVKPEPPGLTFTRPRRALSPAEGGPTRRRWPVLGVVAGLFGLILLIVMAVFFVLQLS